MAIVNNIITKGFSGMLGESIVFKQIRGKTIACKRPSKPVTQSKQQKGTRDRFREASEWAKNILLDAEQKAYYKEKARRRKLPNAYTAAIADYMRKPKIKEIERTSDQAIHFINKKDFDVRKVEISIDDANGEVKETRLPDKKYAQDKISFNAFRSRSS